MSFKASILLRLLVATGLLLGPFAPMATACAPMPQEMAQQLAAPDQESAQGDVMAASHDCCDEGTSSDTQSKPSKLTCKAGCISVPAIAAVSVPSNRQAPALVVDTVQQLLPPDWLGPPLLDPPKATLLT